ncbi:MAG: chemotaxis protein CheC, partial [Methanobacteriota archaeon]
MNIPEEVLDGIRELITIGVGRSGGMLYRLTNAHVTLTVPDVHISDLASENYMGTALHQLTSDDTSYVTLKFSGELTGSFSLMIPYSSALNLVFILTREEGSPDEMDALRVETLLEVGNIIISSVMSAFSILL